MLYAHPKDYSLWYGLGQGAGKSHSGDKKHRKQGRVIIALFYPSLLSTGITFLARGCFKKKKKKLPSLYSSVFPYNRYCFIFSSEACRYLAFLPLLASLDLSEYNFWGSSLLISSLVFLQIKAFLMCSKLRPAYLLAVKLETSRAGPLVQDVLQAAEEAQDSVMQNICRQWLAEHNKSSQPRQGRTR